MSERTLVEICVFAPTVIVLVLYIVFRCLYKEAKEDINRVWPDNDTDKGMMG